ncbi:MAG: maleylpyruvate isomerase N-terminal domain-containing protein [Acidimicrobiales bacterium]|nr:maleylpyruvate isomerase N-terminal domain-containing protein [Acidimicrobiales bacterium]
MEPAQHVDALEADAAALADAAERAGLDAAVPSCPGWHVGDLVAHVGRVHRWATTIVVGRLTDAVPVDEPAPIPAGPELLAWYRATAAELVAALRAIDPDEPLWVWADAAPTAAFWIRRQALETVVHRWDAEAAAGAPGPIRPALGADGIDELLDVLLPTGRLGDLSGGNGETIHVHATDIAGEWLIRLDPGGPVVTRGHAKGDVAARGPAGRLLLLLWGRLGPADLEVFGDASLLERWRARVRP